MRSRLLVLCCLLAACDAAVDEDPPGERQAGAGAAIAPTVAERLLVAPDGVHVVALRGHPGCMTSWDATLLTGAPAVARDLEPGVAPSLPRFAPGGRWLVYLSGACGAAPTLRVMSLLDARGGSRDLAADVAAFWPGADGVVFKDGSGALTAAAYDGRWSRRLSGASEVSIDPKGARAAYLAYGELHTIALATGDVSDLGAARSARWALGGERLLVVEELGLASELPDGRSRIELLSKCRCQTFALGRAGATVATDVLEPSTGTIDVAVVDVRGGGKQLLASPIVPHHEGLWGRLRFADDGESLAAFDEGAPGEPSALYVATAGSPLWRLAEDVDDWSFSPASDSVQVLPRGGDEVRLISLAGEYDTDLLDTGPFTAWEPTSRAPRLLTVDRFTSRLRIVGRGVAPADLPGAVNRFGPTAFWAGGRVVYLAGDTLHVDTATIAKDVADVAWADGTDWIYYARRSGGIYRVRR